jgi:hypothetical protein
LLDGGDRAQSAAAFDGKWLGMARGSQEEGMDWLEFRPWSRDVERFCRTWLEQASRHRVPSGPPRADQSALMREYAKSCGCLLVLAEEDGDPPFTHTRN